MGREEEREGTKHQCVVASHAIPSGDLACNPAMCPDWESNWQPFGLQAHAQSTELHQPGRSTPIFKLCFAKLQLHHVQSLSGAVKKGVGGAHCVLGSGKRRERRHRQGELEGRVTNCPSLPRNY